ncbi:MAG: Ig-like domain-containing protein [bacterium]
MKRTIIIILVLVLIGIGFYIGYRQTSSYHAAEQTTSLESGVLIPQPDPEIPQIVSTSPSNGASDVDPALDKFTVTFDRDMLPGYAFTDNSGRKYYPSIPGKPYWVDKRTCVCPIKLEPESIYRMGLNDGKFQGFKSTTQIPLPAHPIYFTTQGASADLVQMLNPPVIIAFDPPNDATDVDPNRTTLSVTFNQNMGSGIAWVSDGHIPQIIGTPMWNAEKRTCTVSVKLEPRREYKIFLNSAKYIGFASEVGIPSEPIEYTFKTK